MISQLINSCNSNHVFSRLFEHTQKGWVAVLLFIFFLVNCEEQSHLHQTLSPPGFEQQIEITEKWRIGKVLDKWSEPPKPFSVHSRYVYYSVLKRIGFSISSGPVGRNDFNEIVMRNAEGRVRIWQKWAWMWCMREYFLDKCETLWDQMRLKWNLRLGLDNI